uniref:Cystatin domain-containing protein n=1 Tax=Strigamia maritima TaxID=126957 RepID=T1IQP3_STRMM
MMKIIFLTHILIALARPPLIAYTGQPLELSANGLRSAEANKAAKYAAQHILQEKLTNWHLPRCVEVIPEILYGTYKVVAGIEYNIHLRLTYKPIADQNQICRSAQHIFQDEECTAAVVYQPYKPTAESVLALLAKQCQETEPFFPEARE